MASLDVAVKDYMKLFEKTMELWTTLQEDPTLQRINIDLRNKQLQFDEVSSTTWTLAPVQLFVKFQEEKQLQSDIEELRRKEAILWTRTQSWIEEANQLTLFVQNKLNGMQQTQRTMGLAVEGATTEKLFDEVQQASM